MKKIIVLFAALFSFSAVAADNCVSQAEMQQIASHFKQFSNLATKEYCYDGSPTSHLIAGLMFMRKTQFEQPSTPSRDELFSGRFANGWYDYFIGRINEFEIDNNCPKGVAAYVYGWGGNTMYACTYVLSDNFTALDRASVFMHEARHIDGYPHITCSRGPRQGIQGACDVRIGDGGSYAVTVETYAQLARYATGIHPALKAYARSSAVVYAAETFDTPAQVQNTAQFLVMTNDKGFHQVKVDGTTKALGASPDLGRIVMRGQHMILYPQDLTKTARFVFARNEGEIAQAAGNEAIEYNAQTPEQRANLVDTHIAVQWNAKVYKNKVTFACDPRAFSAQEVALNETPVGLIYLTGYDRGAKTAQLMMESGAVMDLGCEGTRAFVRTSALRVDQKYKSVYKVGALTLGLTLDGNLREITGTGSRPFSLGALDGKITELAPNQSVDFFNET